MGKIFEKMAKEYLILHAGTEGFPVITEITDYQNTVIDSFLRKSRLSLTFLSRKSKLPVLKNARKGRFIKEIGKSCHNIGFVQKAALAARL